ncbi:FAD-binding oxidoreductase [Streptococcus suis]|nr:FAD-binding oxidoreductase [Streptococcus suis]
MFKKNNYALGLVWMIAVGLLPTPFLYSFFIGTPGLTGSSRIGIGFGIIAYVWMLLAIYIGTKPKWLDRLIGLPAAYMLHGILSSVAIVLAFMHKNLSPSYGLVALTGNIAFILFLSLALYSMIFMAGWLTSRIPLLAKLKRQLEIVFKHEISIWLHRLNLIATFLIFIHVQLIGYIRENLAFMAIFYFTSLFVFASYILAKCKPTAAGFSAKLVSNTEVGPNIYELRIKVPVHRSKQMRPGDFIFISFPGIKGLTEPHPFSIVNDPRGASELILAIRGDGDFTRQLQSVQTPTTIAVDGGYGMYQSVIDDQAPKQLLAISGGIGVTPILSVIEGNPHIHTTVFHGASTDAALIYGERFAKWQAERDNLIVNRVVGMYQAEDVLRYLPEDKKDFTVLISGPAAMARYWVKVLVKQGVPKSQIFYEEFGW